MMMEKGVQGEGADRWGALFFISHLASAGSSAFYEVS